MKPILLVGHERSLTFIKYNRDGDLLFTASKDKVVNVWWSDNGERFGTYNGHKGAVWCLDTNVDSTILMTGGADSCCKLWELTTGKELHTFNVETAVRTVGFSLGGDRIFFSNDKRMRKPHEIYFFNVAKKGETQETEPYLKISVDDVLPKVTAAVWGPLDEYIVTGHEDGALRMWNATTGEMMKEMLHHTDTIRSIRMSKDQTMFVTASKDHSACLFSAIDLRHLKTYQTDKPVNGAAMSPIRDHVVIGGGQEAMSAALTSSKSGKFDSRFFHTIFEEEIGRVKGHFGPINTIDFHPDGRSYATGAEDGFVRINHLDDSYFMFEYQH